jgi:hypothetical protein
MSNTPHTRLMQMRGGKSRQEDLFEGGDTCQESFMLFSINSASFPFCKLG